MCSLQYTTVDAAVKLISEVRTGFLDAKVDIQDAYRNVPVHPDDCHLLGMEWHGKVFIDKALPFGPL